MKINRDTKIIISASSRPGNFGATLYNEIFKKEKLNYVYIPVKFTNARKLLDTIKNLNIYGSSISMPLKEKVFNYVKYGDAIIKKSKSINTILYKRKKLIGYNTDIYGSYEILKKLKFTNVLIFGSGGVTRSLIISLKKLRKKISICSRNLNKSKKISKEFSIKLVKNPEKPYDLIINATPITNLKNISKFIPLKHLLSSNIFMDLNVSSKKNEILKKLSKTKVNAIPGIEMAKHQFRKQFFLYTGNNISINNIEKILKKNFI